jgi:glycosyltransferase involved in cell wall biosynthesis
MDRKLISVIIPTHNPHPGRLAATLLGLDAQTLPDELWEVVLVDNASASPVELNWCLQYLTRPIRIVRELQLGLSSARRCGLLSGQTDLFAFCDDDNILAADYLERTIQYFASSPEVGVAGGRSLPVYAETLPEWYREGIAPLGCRDLGDETLMFSASDYKIRREYPAFAPIGAGMVFRKTAMVSWLNSVGRNGITDRKGDSLSSAGDCDMVLCALDAGWAVAYWPDLSLQHLIPPSRVTAEYLARISRCAFRDFIKVLDIHGIRPWPAISGWTLPFRVGKAWLKFKPWQSAIHQIQYATAVGQFEGRAAISKTRAI